MCALVEEIVEPKIVRGDASPGKFLRGAAGPFGFPGAKQAPGRGTLGGPGAGRGCVLDQPRILSVGVGEYAAGSRSNQGETRGHGLERGNTEGLARIRMNENIGGVVKRRQIFAAAMAQE